MCCSAWIAFPLCGGFKDNRRISQHGDKNFRLFETLLVDSHLLRGQGGKTFSTEATDKKRAEHPAIVPLRDAAIKFQMAEDTFLVANNGHIVLKRVDCLDIVAYDLLHIGEAADLLFIREKARLHN